MGEEEEGEKRSEGVEVKFGSKESDKSYREFRDTWRSVIKSSNDIKFGSFIKH